MSVFLAWDPINMRCDWAAAGSALETAILLALFTDRVATADYVPRDGDPRGHWSDAYRDKVGSNLWELDHAKMTSQAIALAQNSTQLALQPLIDAGVASAIDVLAERQGQLCAMRITVTAPTGIQQFRYEWAWSAAMTGAAQGPHGGPAFIFDSSTWDDGGVWSA
jgi:phage gp46-like protein